MALTDKQIELLGELLAIREKDPDGADALRFQVSHEDDIADLDRLISVQWIERNDKNKFVVPMRTIVEMQGRDSRADALLALCDKIYGVLRRIFKETPERNVLVRELPAEVGLQESEITWALPYLMQAPIWGSSSTNLFAADSHVRVSENVLRYKTFGDVINIFQQWKRSSMNMFGSMQAREKQQKFGILDSPTLLAQDLQDDCGIFGRALLYIDIDDFKAINTALTETVVDRDVLPAIQQTLLQCVTRGGFAYAEGGDEFTILLPNVSSTIALAFANSVRDHLRALRFDGNAKDIRISASIGLAHESQQTDGQSLKEHANMAKQRAKEQGKDRTVPYEAR